MKAYKYRNRYGDVHSFTPTEDGNILWEGNFEYSRYGWKDDFDRITMVDPSGGPYIAEGEKSSIVHPDIKGKEVSHFEEIREGQETIAYKIILAG